MNRKQLTALLVAAVLFICLLPSNAIAARLRIMDNEDYPETYTFYPGVANLPAAFARHNPDNFNLYYIAGGYETAVYCIQIDSPQISWTDDYGTYTEPQVTNLSAEQKYLLSAALCMGHTSGWDNRPRQVATQIVVWLITTGAYANEAQKNAVLNDYIGNADVKAYAKELWDDCVNYYTIPSFCCGIGEIRPIHDMSYDAESSSYYVDLYDENGVVGDFTLVDVPENISWSVDGNTLTLTSPTPFSEDLEIKMLKSTTKYQNRAYLMYMYFSGNQEMAYQARRQNDPVPGFLKLAAIYSSATIIKQSEDDLVAGLKFRITKPGDDTFEPIILETDENGTTQEAVVGLGTYMAEEIDTPARYVQPEPQTFTIDVIGEKVVLTFENKCRDLYLSKTSEDGIVEGLEFRVTCEELEYETTVSTDSEGKWSISGLEPGTYTIEEINVPDQYVPMEAVTVTISAEQETYNVTADNILKRGNVEVNKKDSMFGKNLSNVRFGIYTEDGELVQEVMTDSRGVAVSDELTYGSYYLQELEPAPGYKVNKTQYEFSILEDGCYEIVAVEDDPRIGTVTINYNGRGGIVNTGSTAMARVYLLAAALWMALILAAWSVKMSIKKNRQFAEGGR